MWRWYKYNWFGCRTRSLRGKMKFWKKSINNNNNSKKFGVIETEVQDVLLLNDPHDQLVIAYHLIIDNKRIWNEGLLFISLVKENFY